MKNYNQKYYGQKIIVVNSINVSKVKYKHKVQKKGLFFNMVLASVFLVIAINSTIFIKNIIGGIS